MTAAAPDGSGPTVPGREGVGDGLGGPHNPADEDAANQDAVDQVRTRTPWTHKRPATLRRRKCGGGHGGGAAQAPCAHLAGGPAAGVRLRHSHPGRPCTAPAGAGPDPRSGRRCPAGHAPLRFLRHGRLGRQRQRPLDPGRTRPAAGTASGKPDCHRRPHPGRDQGGAAQRKRHHRGRRGRPARPETGGQRETGRPAQWRPHQEGRGGSRRRGRPDSARHGPEPRPSGPRRAGRKRHPSRCSARPWCDSSSPARRS